MKNVKGFLLKTAAVGLASVAGIAVSMFGLETLEEKAAEAGMLVPSDDEEEVVEPSSDEE